MTVNLNDLAVEIIRKVTAELEELDLGWVINIFNLLLVTKRKGGRIWLAGNGGSASLCGHFASDLMNLGFDVCCMTDNVARLSALTNDYGWEYVYTIQMENHFKEGDVLFLCTVHGSVGREGSGWSANLASAAKYAKEKGGRVLLLSGNDGGRLKAIADRSLTIHSAEPYIVEGIHSVLTHLICSLLKEVSDK